MQLSGCSSCGASSYASQLVAYLQGQQTPADTQPKSMLAPKATPMLRDSVELSDAGLALSLKKP